MAKTKYELIFGETPVTYHVIVSAESQEEARELGKEKLKLRLDKTGKVVPDKIYCRSSQTDY